MRLTFTLLRTLSMSGDVAKDLMRLHLIEDVLEKKVLPVCKNEKDIKLMRHFLVNFFAFIAGFSNSEDG